MVFAFRCFMTAMNILMILLFLYVSREDPEKEGGYSEAALIFIELIFIGNVMLIWF